MAKSLFNDEKKLTHDPTDVLARSTYAGQAHFGGTGPAGATCRQCRHFKIDYGPKGKLTDNSCDEYKRLKRLKVGPRFPPHAPACKYFDQRPTDAPIWKPNAPARRYYK